MGFYRVIIPWNKAPAFPPLCGYCRKPSPDSVKSLPIPQANRRVDWQKEMASFRVPCCRGWCGTRMSLRIQLATSMMAVLPVIGFALPQWPIFWLFWENASVNRIAVSAGIVGAAIGFIAAYVLVRRYPPPMFFMVHGETVEFRIPDREYADALAQLNGAASSPG